MTEWLHFHFSLSCVGEGNGNPLQCSCLENPGDGGAWWASVYGVAQSQTRLKWLSSSGSRYIFLNFSISQFVELFQYFSYTSSALFCLPFLFSVTLLCSILSIYDCLVVSHRSLRFCSFLLLFSFCSSGYVISINLSSGSLILLPVQICCWAYLMNFQFQ